MKKILFLSLLCFPAINAMEKDFIPKTSEQATQSSFSPEDQQTTLLFKAAQEGDVEGVKYYLANGANVNAFFSSRSETPLHYAAHHGHTETCQSLLKNGAKVNQADNNGYSALLLASIQGHTAIVELLLKHGAEVNQVHNWVRLNINGITPLSYASLKGHVDTVTLLLKYGAQLFQNESSAFKLAKNNQLKKLMLEEYAKLHPNKQKMIALLLPLQRFKFPKDLRKLLCSEYFVEADKSFRAIELIKENIKDPERKKELLALFPEENAHKNENL